MEEKKYIYPSKPITEVNQETKTVTVEEKPMPGLGDSDARPRFTRQPRQLNTAESRNIKLRNRKRQKMQKQSRRRNRH